MCNIWTVENIFTHSSGTDMCLSWGNCWHWQVSPVSLMLCPLRQCLVDEADMPLSICSAKHQQMQCNVSGYEYNHRSLRRATRHCIALPCWGPACLQASPSDKEVDDRMTPEWGYYWPWQLGLLSIMLCPSWQCLADVADIPLSMAEWVSVPHSVSRYTVIFHSKGNISCYKCNHGSLQRGTRQYILLP